VVRYPWLALYRAQRRAVDQLDCGRAMIDKRLHRRAGRVHVRKDHKRREPVLIVRDRLENRLRNKRECALRANDQAAEDLERRRTVEEGLHVVPSRVLNTKLLAETCHEFRIRFDFALDFHQASGERRLGGCELLLGIFSSAIDERARGQHEGERR
jgi:hypothetical protein